MEEQEFYRPPQADLTAAPAAEAGLTRRMVELLSQTRPWVLLIAIMGFVVTGLMVLGGLGLAVAVAVSDFEPQFLAIGVLYVFIALIYFFPCLFLLRFAGAIRKLGYGGGAAAMEEALERQYSFWRLIGILTLAVIAIYVLILVIAIVVAAFGAFSG